MKLNVCAFLLLPLNLLAADPWPAEPNTSASQLTGLAAEFTHDMSGASWNPSNRTFWVCNNNPGIFWQLTQNAAGNWIIATNAAGTQARWAVGGDLEGICQADYTKPVVYLMDENSSIREYDVSNYGVVNQTRAWDISTNCPENVSGLGPEAITFVPNEWLQREGFRNNAGQLYTATNGMDGLMFVGTQIGGYVHVFDLKTNANTFTYLGSNQTSRAETAGLEFDRATGKLYIWHNIDANYLEVAELNSTVVGSVRRLRTLIEYDGPRAGNLEGFALVSTPETNDWCMITDDANANSEGVALYRQFVTSEDTDGDGHTDTQEFFAGTDPLNPDSQLRIDSVVIEGDGILLGWRTTGGHTNIVQSALELTNAFADLSDPIVIPGSGDAETNYFDEGGATNDPARFYRIRTAP